MKTRLLGLGLLVSSLFLILLAGCAKDVWTGKWTNEKGYPQKIVCTTGHWKHYSSLSDTTPLREGVGKSPARWTDSDGNIWYKSFATVTEGDGKGYKFVELDKFSKQATVWEYTWQPYYGNTDPAPETYPSKIDPTDTGHYGIYYRAKE